LYWRPRPDLSLEQRIYHLAEGLLALKEIEILGATCAGRLPERITHLIEFILGRIEARFGLSESHTVPERVKSARRYVIKQLEGSSPNDADRQTLYDTLDDLFLVVQAFSYPGDYVSELPSIERIAETLDKFEEDILGVRTATVRGARRASVTFGEPILVDRAASREITVASLTQMLQDNVETMVWPNRTCRVGPNRTMTQMVSAG
jgi:hypothetical protein